MTKVLCWRVSTHPYLANHLIKNWKVLSQSALNDNTITSWTIEIAKWTTHRRVLSFYDGWLHVQIRRVPWLAWTIV